MINLEKLFLHLYNLDKNLSPCCYDHLKPVLLLKSSSSLFQMGLENSKIKTTCTNMK